MPEKRKRTETSEFWVPGRMNHDSSRFYSSRLYENLPSEKNVKYVENSILDENINRIFCKSSEIWRSCRTIVCI